MTEIKGISVDEWKKKICEEAERLRPQLIELAHSIHDEPEIGFQEFKSSAKICDFLEKQGFALDHLSRRLADGVQRAFQFLGFLAG